MARSCHGWTLVEILLSIAFVGLLGLTLAAFMREGVRSYHWVSDRHTMHETLRLAVAQLQDDVTITLNDGVLINDPQHVRLDLVDTADNINYKLSASGTDFKRDSVVLVPNTTYLLFSYFKLNGAVASDPTTVRRVRVEIENASQQGHAAYRIRTMTLIRRGYYKNFKKI